MRVQTGVKKWIGQKVAVALNSQNGSGMKVVVGKLRSADDLGVTVMFGQPKYNEQEQFIPWIQVAHVTPLE